MSLSKLAVRRLTKLCEFMEGLPRSANQHFYMGSFFHHHGEHPIQVDEKRGADVETLMDCGTSACALGWAATVPAFKKAGLSMVVSRSGYIDFRYNGRKAGVWSVARRFFGLNDPAELFGDLSGIETPNQWAKHCRRFIKANT